MAGTVGWSAMSNLMNEIGKAIAFFFGLPKSLLLNFRYLPLSQAIRLPILISPRVKLRTVKGSMQIDRVRTGMIQIGFGSLGQNAGRQDSVWALDGHIHFKGKARIGCGVKLFVRGNLTLGDNIDASHNWHVMCHNNIDIGDNSLLSWNVTIMDSDGHDILQNGQAINPPLPIQIGRHVWSGCDVLILKGANIADNCIVAARSVVTAAVSHESGTMLAGSPAKVIRRGVTWK